MPPAHVSDDRAELPSERSNAMRGLASLTHRLSSTMKATALDCVEGDQSGLMAPYLTRYIWQAMANLDAWLQWIHPISFGMCEELMAAYDGSREGWTWTPPA